MHFDRAAGVLLHVTSLPSTCRRPGDATDSGLAEAARPARDRFHADPVVADCGVGDLGGGAYRFVDFLHRAGQRVWQMLPLGPTIHGDSPYSCYSAFAGNPLLISVEGLAQSQLLSAAHLQELTGLGSPSNASQCDYELARRIKSKALQLAFETYRTQSSCALVDAFESYCTARRWWLEDFALFSALMKHWGTDDWTRWDEALVHRDTQALGVWRDRLSRQIEFEQFVQFLFDQQWNALRAYANQKGIQLFGDMPIFVAHGSSDVWANQSRFDLKADGCPRVVAGVPPDYFSKTGQLWGNPLYHWTEMRNHGYRWWIQRLQAAFELYDLLRIDHFRGFESYWAVPASAKTAASGAWVQGPGKAPFLAASQVLGELPIVAEDLGLITDEVHQLREELAFPGMRVLQFGFDHQRDVYHRPNAYPENCVAYSGTHDNSTLMAWYRDGLGNQTRSELLEPWLARQSPAFEIHWKLLSMVYRSQAMLTMAPLQDILALGKEATMNRPGQAAGNWLWRCKATELSDELADQLRSVCQACGRKANG